MNIDEPRNMFVRGIDSTGCGSTDSKQDTCIYSVKFLLTIKNKNLNESCYIHIYNTDSCIHVNYIQCMRSKSRL